MEYVIVCLVLVIPMQEAGLSLTFLELFVPLIVTLVVT